jgi:hypothetical protein
MNILAKYPRMTDHVATLEFIAGVNLRDAIELAIEYANEDELYGKVVSFEIDGITIRVNRDSNSKLVHAEFLDAQEVGSITNVGIKPA